MCIRDREEEEEEKEEARGDEALSRSGMRARRGTAAIWVLDSYLVLPCRRRGEPTDATDGPAGGTGCGG